MCEGAVCEAAVCEDVFCDGEGFELVVCERGIVRGSNV